MTDFVQVDITSDPDQLVDEAIDTITTAKPGYVANDSNLEIIVLGAAALMFANATTAASVMQAAAFRALGTKLFNVVYEGPASATASTTWTVVPSADGYTIPAGTYLTIDDFGFYVQADTPVDPDASTAAVTIVAAAAGTTYNALDGDPETVDQIDWVLDVSLDAPTSGGADAETDSAYEDRFAGLLQLQAPRPITAADYRAFVLSVPSTILPEGVVVGRATSIDGYDPDTDTYDNAREVCTFVTDPDGIALDSDAMDAISAWLATYREANFLTPVAAPTYHTIYATYEIHVLPGYDPAAVLANADSALLSYLSPKLWGSPSAAVAAAGRWLNSTDGFNIVRYNKVLGIIENTPGVDYVPAGSAGLAIGLTASPTAVLDLTMTGPAPLPLTNLTTPTIIGTVA